MKKNKEEKRLQSPIQFLIKKIKPVLPLHEREYASIFAEAIEMENKTAQQLVDMGGIFFSMLIDKHLEILEQDVELGDFKCIFSSLRSYIDSITKDDI